MTKDLLPTRDDFRFFERLQVRWAEVDAQQIVFNAHFLTYFDVAATRYWGAALVLPYDAAMVQREGDMVVRSVKIDFHAPARFGDWLDIGVRCHHIGNSSMVLHSAIFLGNQLLVTYELIYVFIEPATQSPRRISDGLRAVIADFEAGRDMLDVCTGDWASLGDAAAAVRTAVFVDEQGIAREDEWDAADAEAVHAVIFNRFKAPVATGRLLYDASGAAFIGRMAAIRAVRGMGLGQTVIGALEAVARARGDVEIQLSAQRSVEGFYRRLGYVVDGEPYDEVGIPHIRMRKTLAA